MEMMNTAIANGLDADQLAKFTDLIERWENRRAAEKFADALARFQSLCPTVFKRRATKEQAGSTFGYNFASFDDVMREAGPVLAECGIVVGFDTEHNLEKNILTITCRVRVGSHYEDRKFACPTTSTLKVSDAQKFGSALSYAKRYCFCAALNIVVTDEDDDGVHGTFEYIGEGQLAELERLIEEKHVDLPRFLKWAEIESLDKMVVSEFPKALDTLNRKQRSGA